MDSRDVIAALRRDSWQQVAQKGSHLQLKHPTKPGRVTVPHPKSDIARRNAEEHRAAGRLRAKVKSMTSYIARIHKEPKSDFGVSFPDFPGCVSAGNTLDEARKMAQEALSLHVEGMIEDGEALPEPSSLDEVMSTKSNRDAAAFIVTLPERSSQIVRVNITLPASDLKAIDAFAEVNGLTRSGFLITAARSAMKRTTKSKKAA